jgi:uncharacterized protein
VTEGLSSTNPPGRTPILLPDTADPVAAPFWAGNRQGRLLMQRCSQCHALRWPPNAACPECLTAGGAWEKLSGRGTVWSYAVYNRGFHPDFADQVPYTVMLVTLDEGPHMISSLPQGVAASEIAIGCAVTAKFTEIASGIAIVQFRPQAAE